MKKRIKKISKKISKYFEVDFSFFPLKKDLKKYKTKYLRNDLFSALSVALLAIPQAIAYSLLAGLPPSAGIFSAIFGTIFVGTFSSSKRLISGPTTGVAILIQTTIAGVMETYYPLLEGAAREEMVLFILMQMVLLIGLLQILAAFFKLGKALQFVSRPVVLGYFAGVGIAIVTNQLFYLFDISYLEKSNLVISKLGYLFSHLGNIHIAPLLLGIFAIALLLLLRKYLPKWPTSILMLVGISVLSYFINNLVLQHGTDKIWYISNLGDLGVVDTPFLRFSLPKFNIVTLNIIFPSALAIALLAILETFSVSTALSGKSGERVNGNQQMFSLGVANTFLSSLLGAMPASGSISRSVLNHQSGAKTRVSTIVSGLFVGLIVYFFWPYVRHIPLAALAALLIVLVPRLIKLKDVKLCFRATKGDAVVFILTMISCVFFSLSVAFFIGIAMSIASYLRHASVPHLVEYTFNPSGRLMVVSDHRQVHRRVRVIGMGGELFFASVEFFQHTLFAVAKDPYVKAIVLRLDGVYHMDVSMCFAILQLADYLKEKNRYLIISGISGEIWKIFFRTGIVEKIGRDSFFLSDETKPQLSTWRACQKANELISTK